MSIIWSAPAVADLEAIYDYIARDSPHYALRRCWPAASYGCAGRLGREREDSGRKIGAGGTEMASSRRSEIVQACAFGAIGLLGVGFAVHDLVLQRPLAYELALAVLVLVMAAQLAVGASQEARGWVGHTVVLLLFGAFLPHLVEVARESVLSLAGTAAVILLLAAGWVLSRSRRRARPS